MNTHDQLVDLINQAAQLQRDHQAATREYRRQRKELQDKVDALAASMTSGQRELFGCEQPGR